MKNFINFTLHKILLWYSDDGKGAMYSKEMTSAFNILVGGGGGGQKGDNWKI
jgi:hypothetical protein